MTHHILIAAALLPFCYGCAGPSGRAQTEDGVPPGYALFSITLHCEDRNPDPVPTVREMVEMELAGQPYLSTGELEAPPGWGVPFDACSTLLESMREGASELLPTAKFERAHRFQDP